MSEQSEGCLAAVIGTVVSVPLFIYQGWVATLLWGWFVVPTFGAEPIPITVAIGVGALVWLVAPKSGSVADQESDHTPLSRALLVALNCIVGITTVLVVGWVCASIGGYL
jgi:hypothetical protein